MTATPSASDAEPARRPLAVGLGEVLWDLLPSGKQLGGAPANFAYHARQLGAAGAVVSAVGNDPLGDEIEDRLQAADLACAFTRDRGHPTGTVSVKLDEKGVPSYVIHQPVAWDFIELRPGREQFQAVADVVCFGTLAQRSPRSRESIRRYLRETRPQCLRVFDVNLRQDYFDADVVRESLQLANVLKINDQELPVVTRLLGYGDATEADAMARLIDEFSLRLLALTRGAHGSTLATAGETDHHGGVATTLVDTVGAGDAFTAALAIGMLRDEPLARLNAAANRLAAYVCARPGATPAIPPAVAGVLWD